MAQREDLSDNRLLAQTAGQGCAIGAEVDAGRVVVATEHHFVEVGGRIYTSLAFGYDYWKGYLEVFDGVDVLARLACAERVPEDHFIADGPGVRFIPVPDYLGPKQFFRHLPGVLVSAFRAARQGQRFILRSGNVCTAIWLWLMLLGKPYSREALGHVGEAIRQFTRRSRWAALGAMIAAINEALAKTQFRHAFAASYVCEYLHKLYPTGKAEREFVFSDIVFPDGLLTGPRPAEAFAHKPMQILSVGRLELEKGHHILIDAATLLKQRGVADWRVRIVGPGRQLAALRSQAESAGLADRVELLGPVQYGPDLFAQFDWADLFVLPSLTEGMPRSLIEAMVRGLPAIGSRTGGIVELLSDSQLVQRDRADALAQAIEARIGRNDLLAADPAINFKTATEKFQPKPMRRCRLAFWNTVLAGPGGRGESRT